MSNNKVILTGCFDGYHPGHNHLITEAEKYGSVYVILMTDSYIQTTKHRGPRQTYKHRLAALYQHHPAIALVYAARQNSDVERICRLLSPSHRVVGDDYTLDQVVNPTNAQVVIVPRLPGYASSVINTKTTQIS